MSGVGWGGMELADAPHPLPPSLPDSYMTSRTVREASGLQSLTSTLYLRVHKEDRDASFHCSAHYSLPQDQHGHLDSPAFSLTLHCASTLAPPPCPWTSHLTKAWPSSQPWPTLWPPSPTLC